MSRDRGVPDGNPAPARMIRDRSRSHRRVQCRQPSSVRRRREWNRPLTWKLSHLLPQFLLHPPPDSPKIMIGIDAIECGQHLDAVESLVLREDC